MQRIAIFASGTGTNAARIIEYFKGHKTIEVSLVLSNNSKAPVLDKATNADVETYTFNRETFYNTNQVLNKLNSAKIDMVILAGFMWLVPENLVHAYSDHIMNIHPALLPKYGGKGMYGMHVHRAVKEAGETETGVTIHLVNKEYDKGRILAQAKCVIDKKDTPEIIAEKIHALEYANFPVEIERYLLNP
ncbi:MAG TPA: phosphoribosylglycinamide formyltransferase [Flavobacteriales bacterium]|nr:phosphoribosylglycinamide formyltransferase [Flavobacteriales bacterium]